MTNTPTPPEGPHADLIAPLPESARMDAYYYGFDRTEVGIVDAILSAVAVAGKGAHHTESWGGQADYEDNGYYRDRPGLVDGDSPVDLIQKNANRAAEVIRAALSGSVPREVACPHWAEGRVTMRAGCTACTATAERERDEFAHEIAVMLADQETGIGGLRVQRDEALAVIEQAPHAEDCDRVLYPEVGLYPGGDSVCDCFKSQAPADALARVKAEAGAQALDDLADQYLYDWHWRNEARRRAAALREGAGS